MAVFARVAITCIPRSHYERVLTYILPFSILSIIPTLMRVRPLMVLVVGTFFRIGSPFGPISEELGMKAEYR